MNAPALKPFKVYWEARNIPGGGFGFGARRIVAADERLAADTGRQLIARDNAWPEGNVTVVDVQEAT